MPEGTFVLADIGGYTQFLTGVGLEHGKEITSHLLNSLLKCNRGRWKVANIEGDCLFFYREGREPPDELVDHVRALFEDFCDRTIDIAARASCACGACSRTNELALKFIVHAGEFDTQRIGRRKELIGADVVVAHRLLKNSVATDEYVLLTRPYADSLTRTALPAAQGRDEYEGIGAVDYVCLDLEPVRRSVEQRNLFFVSPGQARLRVEVEIQAPPELVWHALTDQEQQEQPKWHGHRDVVIPGRHGNIGTIRSCVHAGGSGTHVLTAFDEPGRRLTEKDFFRAPLARALMKEAYSTVHVRGRPQGGSSLGFYLTFRETLPIVSRIFAGLVKPSAQRAISAAFGQLKAYCEGQSQER